MIEKTRTRSTAIMSLIVLCCGIIIAALLWSISSKAEDMVEQSIDSESEFSSYTNYNTKRAFATVNGIFALIGGVYVVPGILGLIAAAAGMKGMYIAHLIIEIIMLLIGGLFFLASLVGLFSSTVSNAHSHCVPVFTSPNKCDCEGIILQTSCDEISSMRACGYSLLAFFIIGWIALLCDTVNSSIVACCTREIVNPGAVILQAPPITTVIHTGVSMAPYPPHPAPAYRSVPTTSDTASLVQNAEYGAPPKYPGGV